MTDSKRRLVSLRCPGDAIGLVAVHCVGLLGAFTVVVVEGR